MRVPTFLRRLLARLPVSGRKRAGGALPLTPDFLLADLRHRGPSALREMDGAQVATVVRVLAVLRACDDPHLTLEGERVMQQITRVMPEAPILLALHDRFRSGRHTSRCRPKTRINMGDLHRACHRSRPVSFTYIDGAGRATSRRVLPLELVHPDRGILLLARCELRDAYRKFYVHRMGNLTVHDGDFSRRRLALLHGVLEEEVARQEALFHDA